MSDTTNALAPSDPIIWTSGDWVEPTRSESPYNGIKILFTPVYDPDMNKLTTLNVEIQDYTQNQTGMSQSATFSIVTDGARVQIQPLAPVTPSNTPTTTPTSAPTETADNTDATPEPPVNPPTSGQSDADDAASAESANDTQNASDAQNTSEMNDNASTQSAPAPNEAESAESATAPNDATDDTGAANADSASSPKTQSSGDTSPSQTPEQVSNDSTDQGSSNNAGQALSGQGESESKASGFTVRGSLELRFTQDNPGMLVIMASLSYGLPEQRHNIQGGLKSIPLFNKPPDTT